MPTRLIARHGIPAPDISRLADVPSAKTAPQKKCDFDSAGKVLHQMRQKIAALSAPKASPKLVTGFSDPHCGQIVASSDRGSRRPAWHP